MKIFKEHNIAITGLLEDKEYYFDFKVNNDFFSNRNNPQLTGGSVDVKILFLKKNDGLFLNIEVSGFLNVICNRCLDTFSQFINFKDNIIVIFGDDTNFDTTESYVILDRKANDINVSQFIYEFCEFALPISCIHPDNEKGKSDCNKKMLIILNKYKKEEQKIDPRWEKLKQFIN